MGSALPDIGRGEFDERLQACSPVALSARTREKLFIHYAELRLWNPRLSLVGPGDVGEIVERHYGESLAALPLVPAGRRQAADVGSGAGFPGLVLAAARPDLRVTLVESRRRKWSFLRTVTRKASLSCVCLNARVGAAPPEGFPTDLDLVTVRALKLGPAELRTLASRLGPGGRFLCWAGEHDPEAPGGFAAGRQLPLAGGRRRRIVELVRVRPPEASAPPRTG